MGSILSSIAIQQASMTYDETLEWFSLGLNSDVSSSYLKLASAMYCAGDLVPCEQILDQQRTHMLQTPILTQCFCYALQREAAVPDYLLNLCDVNNEYVIKHNIALCVIFRADEVNCIPKELKYEMFRSTGEDRNIYRDKENDDWMDWAVVDSLPYLYFLQYKVYRQLNRTEDSHRALEDLGSTIETELFLGHRETALNLLGQCMEQHDLQSALYFYKLSLKIRQRNNAAKWHACRLLARVFKSRNEVDRDLHTSLEDKAIAAGKDPI